MINTLSQSSKPCSYFQRGQCKFGDRCRFSHQTGSAPFDNAASVSSMFGSSAGGASFGGGAAVRSSSFGTGAGVGSSPFGASAAVGNSPFGGGAAVGNVPFGGGTAAGSTPFGANGATPAFGTSAAPFGGGSATFGTTTAGASSTPFGNAANFFGSSALGAPTTFANKFNTGQPAFGDAQQRKNFSMGEVMQGKSMPDKTSASALGFGVGVGSQSPTGPFSNLSTSPVAAQSFAGGIATATSIAGGFGGALQSAVASSSPIGATSFGQPTVTGTSPTTLAAAEPTMASNAQRPLTDPFGKSSTLAPDPLEKPGGLFPASGVALLSTSANASSSAASAAEIQGDFVTNLDFPSWSLTCYGPEKKECLVAGEKSAEEVRWNHAQRKVSGSAVSTDDENTEMLTHLTKFIDLLGGHGINVQETNVFRRARELNPLFSSSAHVQPTGPSASGSLQAATTMVTQHKSQPPNPWKQTARSQAARSGSQVSEGNDKVAGTREKSTQNAPLTLSAADMREYQAANFTFQQVPEAPPPPEMCK
ncbi:hypothetical protein FVE85_3158 [Porphyridium purpureum]|uniref:C3H1-type domain-containing protein n=1 Tax=Porphyridium purpureum TaxID=35688 RepID=A0A5J4YWT7_PORPP|nr:hypothetical protein FVE85_3158 [Porphyridium purpureum]|eukprot:POR7676..scf227_4